MKREKRREQREERGDFRDMPDHIWCFYIGQVIFGVFSRDVYAGSDFTLT